MGRLLPAAETGRLCMADPEPPLGVIHILRKHFIYQPQHFHEFFEQLSPLCTKKCQTTALKILSNISLFFWKI